jgi:cytochrome c biogenesis protein CcdA
MSFQIAALALLDSLNILTLAIAIYLLGTPMPVPRTVSYIAGTSLGYFSAGLILQHGWRLLADQFFSLLDAGTIGMVQVIGGVILAILGIHAIYRPAREVVFRPPQRISPAATFVLGAVIGLLYAPTDPRHNMAIGLMVAHAEGLAEQIYWLIWYNFFYVLPLLAMVMVRLLWPEHSRIIFGWLTDAISNFVYRILPYLIAGAGFLLTISGIWRLTVN